MSEIGLTVVSDGTFEGTHIITREGLQILSGFSAIEIVAVPGKPVEAKLTFTGVELGVSVSDQAQSDKSVPAAVLKHRPLS